MRIRTIKPEFWSNEKLCSLSECTHLFAAALLNYVDDEGYFNANPGLIKGYLFPLRETSRSIPVMLQELFGIGYLKLGESEDGRQYGFIVHFVDHQVINKKTPSKIKPLQISWYATAPLPEPYGSATTPLPEPYGSATGGNGMEHGTEQGMDYGSGEPAHAREPKPKSKRKTILDPSWEPNDTHQELAGELGLNLPASVTEFRDYEAAHRRTMADWDAAFRTWLRKSADFKKNRRPKKIEEHNRIAQDLDAWAKRKMEEKRGRVIDCEVPESHFGLLPGEVRAGKRDR